jgi:hypothetical protein
MRLSVMCLAVLCLALVIGGGIYELSLGHELAARATHSVAPGGPWSLFERIILFGRCWLW